jgi:outer membrane protein assembly factor BamB
MALLSVPLGNAIPGIATVGFADGIEELVTLPTDRARERQLDQIRRLLADARWSDAAALCDEILAAPRDAFLRSDAVGPTRRSLKAEVARLLREQPAAARQAYELLHGPRAASRLAEAIEADDHAAIVAVARRWLETPAGHAAAVIAATVALENGQTAIATAWLDRLAAAPIDQRLRDLLASVRATADAAAEGLATDALAVDRPDGRRPGPHAGTRPSEWLQDRGDAARNAIVPASRPLLVPRFRVPLVRHPAEARLLDRQREEAAARGVHLMPAGSPVAVDGIVLMPSVWGLVAVDFASGKRLWMQPGGGAAAAAWRGGEDLPRAATRQVFEDATAAGLVVAAGHACVIESPGERMMATGFGGGFPLAERGQSWNGGNRLVAYDIGRRGAAAWRLPAAGAATWYLGSPLAVGDDLYVLAEEKGEVRLELINAGSGAVTWSQPLAEIEVDQAVTNPGSSLRRMAGLSPALADGVLVCPLGVGTVIGVDVASRTLLWAHQYRTVDTLPNGVGMPGLRRLRAGGITADDSLPGRPRDNFPVIADGRVFLAPYDAEQMVCLDLREGTPVWPEPGPGGVVVAGVVGRQALIMSGQGLEALDVESGKPRWKLPWRQVGGHPSGRGIATPTSFLVPLDSAEVIEVRIADGTIAARCPARGGLVPGNLIAYRGEVISRGLDSLDVFHQVEALEDRIQTAGIRAAGIQAAGIEGQSPTQLTSPQLAYWQGQLDLEQGRVARGLREVRTAAATPGLQLPPGAVAEAILFGMQRDFGAAAPEWRSALSGDESALGRLSGRQRSVLRAAVAGFLRGGDVESAWDAAEPLLEGAASDLGRLGDSGGLVNDPDDPALRVGESRWLRGRLAEFRARASDELRPRIDRAADAVVATANRPVDAVLPIDPVSSNDPVSFSDPVPPVDAAAAWPLGSVLIRREQGDRDALGELGRTHPVAVPVEAVPGSLAAGLTVVFDAQMQRRILIVRDRHGRRITEPLQIEQSPGRNGVAGLPSIEAAALGRLLFVRYGGAVMAYDLQGGSGQRLWTHAGGGTAPREAPFVWRHGAAGRALGSGGVAIGMIITEPDDVGRTDFVRAGRAWPSGVLHHDGSSLVLLDPVRGTPLWERRRLPLATDLIGDEAFVCVVAAEGRESLVLSMEDGRLLHSCRLPSRHLRLGASGRRIVSVRHPEGVPLAETGPGRMVSPMVDIELFDPVSRQVTTVGTVPGESRAVLPGDDRLVVLAPDGWLTVFDLLSATVAFRTRLPEMPAAAGRLHVVPWEDRYLVIAGTEFPADGGHPIAGGFGPGLQVSTIQQLLVGSDVSPPLTGAVWAVDRSSGDLLWPAPATIDRQCLHTAQPAGLPVLFFCRLLHAAHQDHDSARLSLLCLDRRTGHAVLADDTLTVQPHALFGCDIEGDPDTHTVTIREIGRAARRFVLDFTGNPLPPQPPFRAARSVRGGAWGTFERLLEQLPVDAMLRR